MNDFSHTMNIVYFSLGSNQGNRIQYLQQSIEAIGNQVGEILRISSYYETEPWGFSSNDRFINQAICVKTELTVIQILEKILNIEIRLGRTRFRNAQFYVNRIIDIDILFYADQVYNFNNLVIPHKYIHERRFVLEPLNEIAPDFVHPLLKMKVHELLKKCSDKLKVNRIVFTESIV